jgi:hypothetical protein
MLKRIQGDGFVNHKFMNEAELSLLGTGNGQEVLQIQLLEGQLAWFVHIISAILKGRLSSTTSSAESQVTQTCHEGENQQAQEQAV